MNIKFRKEEEMKEFLAACKPETCPLEQMAFPDGCDKNCDQCEAKKDLEVDYVKNCTECAKYSTCRAYYRNDLVMAAPMGPLCDPEVIG